VQRWQASGTACVECDLLDLPNRDRLPPSFDVVYHLAGYTQTEVPNGNYRVNSDGTRNLLHWLGANLRGKRVIHAGTLASVDNPAPDRPIDERRACLPRTPYGRTKLAGENYVRALQAELGYDYTILRLCTIMGPGYRPGGMFGLLPSLLSRNALSTRLNWPGRVSFLCMADLVRVLLTLPDLPQARNELYVVSNGENPTFDEFLSELAEVLGYPRRRLQLPAWLWRWIGQTVWGISGMPGVPHRLRIFAWRLSHMIFGGICADGAKLNARLGVSCQSYRLALAALYGRRGQEERAVNRSVAVHEVPR
jgi:nucleoside-diphosphate-sugar epimerase